MSVKDIFEKLKSEVKVLTGDETKDKIYHSHQDFPDESTAREAFERARQKLFNVNRWSDIPGSPATFALHDAQGKPSVATRPEEGLFMRIVFPGPLPENWVRIAKVREEEGMAEFTVHPSEDPSSLSDQEEKVEHFFTKEASSTFRVDLIGTTLWACEIGQNERINNQGEEAGARALVNTVIAEGGWAGMQKLQWDTLTKYLVHQVEAKEQEA